VCIHGGGNETRKRKKNVATKHAVHQLHTHTHKHDCSEIGTVIPRPLTSSVTKRNIDVRPARFSGRDDATELSRQELT